MQMNQGKIKCIITGEIKGLRGPMAWVAVIALSRLPSRRLTSTDLVATLGIQSETGIGRRYPKGRIHTFKMCMQ